MYTLVVKGDILFAGGMAASDSGSCLGGIGHTEAEDKSDGGEVQRQGLQARTSGNA